MDVHFLALAEKELDDAFQYYQSILDGLGYRFIDEVTQTIHRIKRFPNSYELISKHSRRSLVHKFPYGLIYQYKDNAILIVAVANLHRKPDFWVSREKP